MARFNKKRLLISAGGLTTVAAIAALVVGITFGLFSATQSSTGNTFIAGTVTLGSPSVSTCTVQHVVPGAAGDCTVAVTTGGTEPSDVAIDVAVAGSPASSVPSCYNGTVSGGINAPAAGLYDDSPNGLQISLSSTDGTTPVGAYNLTGLNGATSATQNLLTARSVASGKTQTYDLHWSVPNHGCVDNNYQGATSTFTFIVHSVQAANQPPDSTTPGSVDSTLGWS